MKNRNKNSATKKLMPAIAMLTTSAIMLSTVTYAWFTMSKEVSLTGINLTTTVPSNLEISLGTVSGSTVTAPTETNEATGWSNTVAFGDTYAKTSKLKPASSVNGQSIFYTEDAIENGKKVSATAKYAKATTSAVIGDSTVTDATLKDGYYVDIPVWFRTSTTAAAVADIELAVSAEINYKGDEDSLYKAARVAILNEDGTTQETAGVIKGADATYEDNKGTGITNAAVKATGTFGTEEYSAIYGETSFIKQSDGTTTESGDTVVKVAKHLDSATTYNYGTAKKMIVRVWIEGEDKACYNPNAGQDFDISLTFYDESQMES